MGKGDIKTRKGKQVKGSYGKSRPHKKKKKPIAPSASKPKKNKTPKGKK